MTRITSASLAIASAIVVAAPMARAARPHYGGTLSVQMEGMVRAFDPATVAADGAEEAARARLLPLVFETLTTVDADAGLRPTLATAWEHDAPGARWRFHLRPTVKLHDDSVVDAPQVAAVLAARERAWKVAADGDDIVIDLNPPQADLPWTLADSRYAIGVRTASGSLVGSGPFRVERIETSRVVLRTHEDYWGGRAFVDGLVIEEGRALGDQLTNLEAGRSDLAAVRPTDLRRLAERGLRTATSRPIVLFALVFEPHRAQSPDDAVRAALAASLDRAALCTVLLQRHADPASTFVPSWISGYAPLLRREAAARPSRATVAQLPADRRTLALRVDASDGLSQSIAERIAVDAHEAGIAVTVQAPAGLAPRPDVRLVRIALQATTPDRVLARVMQRLGARAVSLVTADASPAAGAPLEAIFRLERTLLDRDILIPVVHVQEVYGLGERVESWSESPISPTGAWNLASVWLRSDRPARP